MVSKQLFVLVAALLLCAVMGRPADMDESLLKQTSQKGIGSLSDPETDEVRMKTRMFQFPLGPPQGFIPVYYMMPPPPQPSSGGAKQRMRRPYQKEREQDRSMENLNPLVSSDLIEQEKKGEDPASIVDPEPGIVELTAERSSDMDRQQPELSAEDLEQLQTFSSSVQPPRAIPRKLKRSPSPQRVRGYVGYDGYDDGYDGYYGRGYGYPYGGYGGGYRGRDPYGYRGYDDEVIDIDIQL